MLDHFVNLLFQRAAANELVNLYIACLADAKCPIRRLILDRGIPPPVEMKDVAGRRQIQPRAARFERKHEERRPSGRLKPFNHPIALFLRDGSMQEVLDTMRRVLVLIAKHRRAAQRG